METLWVHCVCVIAESAAVAGAIQALDIAFPKDDGTPRDTAQPESYAVKLSATGSDPTTHYGSSFVVTEAIRETLEGMGLASIPGITYWRVNSETGLLETTNHAESIPSIGQTWNWENCLSAMELNPIQRMI
jgi:hypothetical protein